MPLGKASPDLIVVGGGVIGLSVAMTAMKTGLAVRVVDDAIPGAASRVAAGLLAPSLGSLPPRAAAAFRMANDEYPRFLASVRESSGHDELSVGKGILEITLSPLDVVSLDAAGDPAGIRLSSQDVSEQAPDLTAVAAAVLHPEDGWIEPRGLLDALAVTLPVGALTRGRVVRIDSGPDLVVLMVTGERLRCGHVVLAAGSWSPLIGGLSCQLPIAPARGELLVLETSHTLPYAIACEEGYLVPRRGEIVVGSTFELVGYDSSTTTAGRLSLERFAARVIPNAFARATAISSWAGLRPMTPDKLPIIDYDPADRRVVFACGHGKNGLLLAGLTAEIVLDLLAGNRLEADSPFRLDRF